MEIVTNPRGDSKSTLLKMEWKWKNGSSDKCAPTTLVAQGYPPGLLQSRPLKGTP